MILTVDIGNSNIAMGLFCDDTLLREIRLETNASRTTDQYSADILNCFKLYEIDVKDISGAVISSVVPELTAVVKKAIFSLCGADAMVLGPGVKSGLNIRIDNPAQLGADLVAGAVAAIDRFLLPCLIIDLGTATKISVIDKNGIYRGCTISPGVGISLKSLSSTAALLPAINLNISECPAYGTNTVTSMQAGVLHGTAAMIDGMCDRIEAMLCDKIASVIATGGYAESISSYCNRSIRVEPRLLLYGLKLIYEKNAHDED